MPEERLDQPRVGAFVSQGVAGRMPQHVGMRLDIQPGELARLPDDVLQGVDRQRSAALGLESLVTTSRPLWGQSLRRDRKCWILPRAVR
jgi:hypothetical protein